MSQNFSELFLQYSITLSPKHTSVTEFTNFKLYESFIHIHFVKCGIGNMLIIKLLM